MPFASRCSREFDTFAIVKERKVPRLDTADSQTRADEGKPAQRFWRKPWFIVVATILALAGLGAIVGEDDPDSTSSPSEESPVALVDDEPLPSDSRVETDAPSHSEAPDDPSLLASTPAPNATSSDWETAYDSLNREQQNAVKSAVAYLEYSAFSRSGLVDQLEFEGYSTEDANLAMNVIELSGVSWDEQARESAEEYLNYTAFSETGLIEQLEYEGFTEQQARYGVANIEVDWNEQAARSAEQYLDYSSYSRAGLIDQLLFEGYTQAQAEYGVNAAGL